MIDPSIWADTPGMGRAPLAPAPVTQNPMADIARRLIQAQGGEGGIDPRERPQAFAPDPATLSAQQLQGFHEGYGGWNSPTSMGRVPGSVVGGLGTLAGGPLGLGAAAGYAGNRGSREYHAKLQAERTQQMAEAQERGSQARDQRDVVSRSQPDAFFDAYEAGRQAGRGQARDQADISRSSRGSRDTQQSIAI